MLMESLIVARIFHNLHGNLPNIISKRAIVLGCELKPTMQLVVASVAVFVN